MVTCVLQGQHSVYLFVSGCNTEGLLSCCLLVQEVKQLNQLLKKRHYLTGFMDGINTGAHKSHNWAQNTNNASFISIFTKVHCKGLKLALILLPHSTAALSSHRCFQMV